MIIIIIINRLMIKILFNKKELILTDILLLIITEITFSIIVFLWFTFYKLGLIKINPLFALLISFIQNIIIIIILAKKDKINRTNILRLSIGLIIFKVLPLLTFFPNYLNFGFKEIFATIYLYIIYVILVIVIMEIFKIKINLRKIIEDDFYGENYEKQQGIRIVDLTYNELISKII
jgi:hypothetical protein